MNKPWWKSKTILLAIVQAVIGIAVAVDSQNPALGLAGVIAIVKSAVDIAIRVSTWMEIGKEN